MWTFKFLSASIRCQFNQTYKGLVMSKKFAISMCFSCALVSQVFASSGALVSRDGSPVLDRYGKGCETRYQATSVQQATPPATANAGS